MKNSALEQKREISRATMGRLPSYLRYLQGLPAEVRSISATVLAKELKLGEVQVRKDLGTVCGGGRPKIGYRVEELKEKLESILDFGDGSAAVLLGAGRLGRALLDYGGFAEYGLDIRAAFDPAVEEAVYSDTGKPVYPLDRLEAFCKEHRADIGILALPAHAAQQACDRLLANGVRAIWCFAPCPLRVPEGIPVTYENMALSLAHLKIQIQKGL